jgi:hypothetical protein
MAVCFAVCVGGAIAGCGSAIVFLTRMRGVVARRRAVRAFVVVAIAMSMVSFRELSERSEAAESERRPQRPQPPHFSRVETPTGFS